MSPLVEEVHSGWGQWVPGPSSPRLASCEVHVWRADLDRVDDCVLAYLSRPEQERVAGFSKPAAGVRWGRARGLLRSLLGAYLDAAPSGLTFEFGDGGKPRLAGPVPSASICFNVSHSGPLALFAFARAPVGVDVELDRRPIDEAAVAARAFPPDTARSIAALDPRDRRREFLRAWARHEAALKCRGGRLARTGRHGHTDSGTGPQHPLQDPWVGDLPLVPGGAAALACAAPPHHVRCWTCTA